MIVYKVVLKSNGVIRNHYSSIMGNGFPTYKIIYRVGETSTALIGKLFVFKELHFAEKFANTFNVILKCKAKGRVTKVSTRVYVDSSRAKNEEFIRVFWEGESPEELAKAPEGSYVVKSLTPLEVVL